MTRLIGAPWASVHGPSDPRRLAMWSLDLGFSGIAPGPAPRAIEWSSMREVVRDLPFEFGNTWRAVRSGQATGRLDAGLAAGRRGTVEEAMAAVRGAAEHAARLGLARVVLEPGIVPLPQHDAADLDLTDARLDWGEDRAGAIRAQRRARLNGALDTACRALHRICRAFPDHRFCLTLSASAGGLGEPGALEAIFEDLASCELGYWHDTAIAALREHRLGEPQGEALERFAARLEGLTASDQAGAELHLPPGAGLVDFALVGSYLPTRTAPVPVVVELDPAVPPAEIPGVHSFLSKSGL